MSDSIRRVMERTKELRLTHGLYSAKRIAEKEEMERLLERVPPHDGPTRDLLVLIVRRLKGDN